MTTPDWSRIEQEFRANQLSIRQIARQEGVSEAAIRKRAKANGWTRDLSGAVRSRVREELVRTEVRACELAGVTPSEAAIVDAAAARGVEVVRSHRRDIDALRQAAAALLTELHPQGVPAQRDEDEVLVVPIKVTDRSRVLSDLSQTYARLIPLERQAFGLDDVNPDGGVVSVEFEQRLVRARLRVGHTQNRNTLEN